MERLSLFLRNALADALAGSLSQPLPSSTPRRVYGTVHFPSEVTAVIGVRRAGKTTFVHQLRRERLASGTARTLLPYVNFEDERMAGLSGEHLGFLLEEYGRRVPDWENLGTVLWCFDEIQAVPNWERFVRRLLDKGDTRPATGRSAMGTRSPLAVDPDPRLHVGNPSRKYSLPARILLDARG